MSVLRQLAILLLAFAAALGCWAGHASSQEHGQSANVLRQKKQPETTYAGPTFFDSSRPPSIIDDWTLSNVVDELMTSREIRDYLHTIPVRHSQVDAKPTQEPVVQPRKSKISNSTKPKDSNVRKATFLLPIEDSSSDKPTTSTTIVEITPDDLEKRINEQKKLVSENESLDELTKTGQLEQLGKATEWVQKARDYQSAIKQLDKLIENFESDMEGHKKELESMSNPEIPDASLDSDELQSQLEERRSQLQDRKSKLASIQNQMQEQEVRSAQLPGQRTKAVDRLKQIEEGFKDLADNPDDIEKTLSTLTLEAQKLATNNEIKAVDLEVRRMEDVEKLLPLERDKYNKQANLLDLEIKAWEAAFNEARDKEIAAQQVEAQRIRKAAIDADPNLAVLARRNEELAKSRGKLSNEIKLLRGDFEATDAKLESLTKNVDSIELKIEKGITPTDGMLLVEHRQSLVQPNRSRLEIARLESSLLDIQTKVLALKDERETLNSVDTFVSELCSKRSSTKLEEEKFRSFAKELAETKIEYLDSLIKDYGDYRDLVVNTSNLHENLISSIESFRNYLAENAMWIRSTDPINLKDLGQSAEGVGSLFQTDLWQPLVKSLTNRIASRPYEVIIAGLLLLGIILFNRNLGQHHE